MTKAQLLMFALLAMLTVSLTAQNVNPQQVWSQTFDFFNGGSQNSANVVLIGDKIFFIAKDNDEIKLVQIDKDTRQIGWVKNLGYNLNAGMSPQQLVVSNDYNLAVVDSGFVICKISAQTGQDIWMRNLYGSPVQSWKVFAATNYLICRGNRGSLVLLNWQTGEIISQMETAIPYQTPMGIHTVSQDGQSLYLADNCLDGQYWNTSWRVTKLTLSPDLSSYQQDWQVVTIDEFFPRIIKSIGCLYVQSVYLDSLGNTTMKMRRINPQDGETVWTQNIGEPNEFDIQGLIDNGDNVIAYGLHYGDYRPIMVNYNPSGTQTWSYSAPFPEGGFPYAMYRAAVWDGNVLILTGRASYSNQTATNSRAWLSAVSTTVANDDPTIPSIPNTEITCYPNPFRGSTNVKLNQIDSSPTTVSIYNARGQLIRTLINDQKLSPGEHSFVWDGNDGKGLPVASGMYLCRATTGKASASRRMILIR